MRSHTSKSHQAPRPASRASISQRMLTEYAQLVEHGKRFRELRAEILELLGGGVPIEVGPLTMTVDTRVEHRLTTADLIRLLGNAEVERLREQVEPSFVTRLLVERLPKDDLPL